MRLTRGRSEISLLVLCALLLLSMLSIFQLYFYRSTVQLSLDEQRQQLSAVAREFATRLVGESWPTSSDGLGRWASRWAPGVDGVRILTDDGRSLMSSVFSRGMLWEREDALVEHANFRRDGRSYRIEVQRLAPTILARQRSLRILTPLVLIVNFGVLWLVVASIRRWLKPIDLLLNRARELGQALEPRDEVAFILRTFESAIVEMAGSKEELRALEGALLRSMDSGVLLLDDEARVLALNPVGASILQLPAFDAPGKKLDEVLSAHQPLVTLVQKAMAGEVTVQRRELELESSAERRILGLTVHSMRQDDERIRGWLVMFADLTQVKKQLAEERLAESLRQLGELTAGVAHEMRNGLATLKGYIDLIGRGGDRGAIAGYVAELRLETGHLHRVVEDFLSFARPGTVRLEEVDIEALVRRVANDPALDAEVDVEVSRESRARIVSGDPVLLARALTNVVKNAIQAQAVAGQQAERVTITLVSSASEIAIEVADRGAGIAREIRGRLFEAFASAHPQGVGLGLALTRRILALHGGSVTLEDREGGGALAEIRLPSGNSVTESIEDVGATHTDLSGSLL